MNWYDLDPQELNRRISALEKLSASAKKSAAAILQFGVAANSREEWPDVVLEDVLDAEILED